MTGPSRELLLRRDKVKDARMAELEAITEGQLKTITRMNEACVRAEAALAERGREIRKLHWMFTHGSSQISQRELSDQYDLEEKTQHPRTDKANAEFYGGTCARAEEGSGA